MVRIEVKKAQAALVIEIDGRIDATNYTELENTIKKEVIAGNIQLILDISKMEYISSAGLRALLIGYKTVKSLNGHISLCGTHPSVKEILNTTGIGGVFDFFDSVQNAEKSLTPK